MNDNETTRRRREAEDAEYARENSPLSGLLVVIALLAAVAIALGSCT